MGVVLIIFFSFVVVIIIVIVDVVIIIIIVVVVVIRPVGLSRWIQQQQRVLVTDTTMRDAHQSLLATRVRTIDLVEV